MDETKECPRFYWWKGSDLSDFFAEVNARGLNNVRIEFHPEDGLLRVVGGEEGGGEDGGGYNFVHTCPPECP